MIEFLQTYSSWIIFGLVFLFMMRMHGGHGGGGCGMGSHDHSNGNGQPDKERLVQGDESETGQSTSCH